MSSSSGDGGSEWMRKKGGASCPAGQAIRGESGQDGTPAPRPLLRPILVQAAGPWFDDHARPREQGHLISTRILRGPLGEEVATRYFLEDRWAQNAPTKGPPLASRGGGQKTRFTRLPSTRGRRRRNRRTPARLSAGGDHGHNPTPLLPPPPLNGGNALLRGGNIRAVIRLDRFAGRCEDRLWASQLAGGS